MSRTSRAAAAHFLAGGIVAGTPVMASHSSSGPDLAEVRKATSWRVGTTDLGIPGRERPARVALPGPGSGRGLGWANGLTASAIRAAGS